MDTRIYVMTHKHCEAPADPLYHMLHVGHAISEDLGYEGDDSGDNISAKNKNYCELTGLYWLWKNVSCDIIGTCHYRRFFTENKKLLTRETAETILSSYDIILPESGASQYGSVREHYENYHQAKDLSALRELIIERSPEYLAAFDHVFSCNLFSVGNMIIARKEIFDEYCSWLFPLLFELEQRIDISSYNAYQARIWGFLSERLLRVWLTEHTWRIYELPFMRQELVKGYDTLGIKKTELLYRKISLLMEGIVRQYRQELPDMAEPVQPAPGEKIPVWICWWQGIDATPDLVTLCIQSALNHLPQDLVDIHLITLENYQQYVTFPDYIVQKFNEGKISYAHLSDILRVSLLSVYGGLWLDATYYLAKDFPREILTGNALYTLRLATPPWEADIVQGRWSGNCILTPKGNPLCQFLLGSLYYYWRENDTLADYYLIDYLIALAYENFPDIKRQIDACPYSNPHVLELQKELNRPYEKCKFESYLADTGIFKLNHRIKPESQTPDGRPTLYGTLITREFGSIL